MPITEAETLAKSVGEVIMKFLLVLVIPVLCFFGPMALSYSAILYTRWRQKSRISPLTRDLLRSPGESLRREIEDLDTEVSASLAMAVSYPLLMCALCFSQMYWFGAKLDSWVVIVYALFAAIGMVWFVIKLAKDSKKKTRLRLGLECELAMGQELNLLMGAGYRVYHDFPADHFNIDHIAVGPNGVFAVETKGRAKPKNHEGSFDYVVAYDGERLQFPGWAEAKPLEQARRQADWLSDWLTSTLG